MVNDDDESPASLPLHRLAYIVNRSSEARENLRKAHSVTLLAPDDQSLTPPPRKNDDHSADTAEDDESVHPFHSFDKNDDDEERKQRFARIVAYILKYHTLPKAEDAYELADHATVATTLQSSRSEDSEALRIRIEPSWILMPYPHPALQINFYAYSRGPVVIAKNGVSTVIALCRQYCHRAGY